MTKTQTYRVKKNLKKIINSSIIRICDRKAKLALAFPGRQIITQSIITEECR